MKSINTPDLRRGIQPVTNVQDAGAYQELLADVHEAIRQGLDDVTLGRTRGVRESFARIRKTHGLPR